MRLSVHFRARFGRCRPSCFLFRAPCSLLPALLALPLCTPLAAQEPLWNETPRPHRGIQHDLPPIPPKPSLPVPRFHQDNILPDRLQFNTIAKENMPRENLRPWNLENHAFLLDTIVLNSIRPRPLVETPLAPPRLPHETLPAKPRIYQGSMIFLPPLPSPTMIHKERPQFQGADPRPDHRRILGW